MLADYDRNAVGCDMTSQVLSSQNIARRLRRAVNPDQMAADSCWPHRVTHDHRSHEIKLQLCLQSQRTGCQRWNSAGPASLTLARRCLTVGTTDGMAVWAVSMSMTPRGHRVSHRVWRSGNYEVLSILFIAHPANSADRWLRGCFIPKSVFCCFCPHIYVVIYVLYTNYVCGLSVLSM